MPYDYATERWECCDCSGKASESSHSSCRRDKYVARYGKQSVPPISGEPNILTAEWYNLVIDELAVNKAGIGSSVDLGSKKSYGERISAQEWNTKVAALNQLINEANQKVSTGQSPVNLNYSSNEKISRAKSFTDIINAARNARVTCACNTEKNCGCDRNCNCDSKCSDCCDCSGRDCRHD